MPIKGLTDNVTPRFPRLGKLRKGGEKNAKGQYGPDLDHFRFTSENPAIVQAFRDAYGAQPVALHVYLPYPQVDMNFATWKEQWSAGGLMHRCDGETCQIWRTPQGTYSQQPKPCPGGCDEVGRLTVILPELIRAGFVGYVTLETHSLHDLMNMTATLLAVAQERVNDPRGLQGIEFVLRRKQETISTPGKDGQRVRRDKWLVSLEPVASWAQTYLALSAGASLAIEAPSNVDPETGEVLDGETGEVIDAPAPRVVVEPPKPTSGNSDKGVTIDGSPTEPAYKRLPRPWPANVAVEAIRDMAAVTKNELPDNGAWKALIGHLDSAPFDTAKRHALMREVFGVDSSKALNGHQRYALNAWAKPGQVDGKWQLDGRAIAEYTAIVNPNRISDDALDGVIWPRLVVGASDGEEYDEPSF